MKFTDGQWLTLDGVTMHHAAQIRDYKIDTENNILTVFVPCSRIYNRGMTLGGPVLTIKYSSPMPNIIKTEVCHYKGKKKALPAFETFESELKDVSITDNPENIIFRSGSLELKLSKADWNASYTFNGRPLTQSGSRSLSYVKYNEIPYFKEQFSLSVGENVYGLGEYFTPFIKNGQSIDIWNRDGGTSSEQAYKSVPFYITNKGYGVFVAHPERVDFEIGTEKVNKAQFSVQGVYLDYYIIGGDNPKDVLANYTALTGKPALPPAWSFGLWLTTSFTTNYDEKTVTEFIDGMEQRDIPLTVFHFDCFWMKEYRWCDFKWDEDVFPNPPEMLKNLKQKGLKICVWINPYISQMSDLFDEAAENSYLIQNTDGSVWQWDLWQPGMGIVDFTNPKACEWYCSKLKELLDIGVDCFKTDFGERIPVENVKYYNGSDPNKMHNFYSYIFNKTVFEFLEKEKGKSEAVLFARSATAGGQQFPVHWGGDCSANYESMAESLRGGLSLTSSGFGFWSHDISGFEDTAPPDVYMRWSAFGMLSTHSRLHGNSSYRVPWLFGDDGKAVDVLRYFTKLKHKLMPYIFAQAVKTHLTGVPMMRAMFVEFSDGVDGVAASTLDKQYMFGDNLLVAPVFSKDGTVDYYLPEGEWISLISRKAVQGGRWVREIHDFMSLPLMVRPNSIIAMSNKDEKDIEYDYAEDITFYVSSIDMEEDSVISTDVYNTKAEKALSLTLTKVGDKITIRAEGKSAMTSSWKLCFMTVKASDYTIENAVIDKSSEVLALEPIDRAKDVIIKLR